MLEMGDKIKKVDVNSNKSENFQLVEGKGINLKGISIDFGFFFNYFETILKINS